MELALEAPNTSSCKTVYIHCFEMPDETKRKDLPGKNVLEGTGTTANFMKLLYIALGIQTQGKADLCSSIAVPK